MKKLLLVLILLPSVVFAQTSRQEIAANPQLAGGVYLAYPVTESLNTQAPEGYSPFYISHYGRHGSRYLISDNDYLKVIRVLQQADSAGALTELGKDVKLRLDTVWEEAYGRGGELTPLGARQHHDIAQRMIKAYPQVFDANSEITAASTPVMRCAQSMNSFIEGLKEIVPALQVPRESSQRNMYYLNYHSEESGKYTTQDAEYYPVAKQFEDEKTNPERLVGTIFNDDQYVKDNVDAKNFMRALYWVAVDMQNMETPISFMDLFTPDELFDQWEIHNFSFYATNSSYPYADGQHVDNAKNLLRHIVENADDYIANGKHGATLRFGHDGNVIPLTALMQFPNCAAYQADPHKLYEVYSNFKVSPMASNVQIVFFRNPQGEVIVKFMLNEREVSIPAETDMFPYYKWDDARNALQTILDTPSREYIPAEALKR